MIYDYLIVGAGFFGSICAYELNKKGFSVAVIEKRNHIGGNAYTESRDNINIHIYGPHIFHTSSEEVWKWINQFVSFNDFRLNPLAYYKGEIYSLPFNMWTFSKILGLTHPCQVESKLKQFATLFESPSNLEEQAISMVGPEIYNKLIYGYTKKQWRKEPSFLPKEIISRLPIRHNYDGNYFNDTFQGIPIGGYTQIFEKLLKGIDIFLGQDFFKSSPYYRNLIYTGPIDRFFNYEFGPLEYKTTDFQHVKVKTENFQGCPVMNYTQEEVPFTRIIEHKHFEKRKSDCSWISIETPIEYNITKEPYYPVNDAINNNIYKKYLEKANGLKNVFFGGRLAEYKYYDMDKVILSALNFLNNKLIS